MGKNRPNTLAYVLIRISSIVQLKKSARVLGFVLKRYSGDQIQRTHFHLHRTYKHFYAHCKYRFQRFNLICLQEKGEKENVSTFAM